MSIDLTNGPVTKKMMLFSLPLIAGNLLQQTYNIADTVIVGRFLGADALAALGSSYALMTFLTSILLGLCMGSGALFSIRYGEKNEEKLKESIGASFLMIAAVAILLNGLVCRKQPYSCTDGRIYRHNGSGGCQICGLDGFPNYCSGPGPLVPVINGHIRQRAKIFRTGMYLKPSFEIHPGPE